MIAAIPVMIAIGVQQQLTIHTTEMIPKIIAASAIPLVCSCCGCSYVNLVMIACMYHDFVY